MKFVRSFLTISLIFLISSLFAQTPDLILQTRITPEYIEYLTEKEQDYQSQVEVGGDDPLTMKAHMGLAILQLEWSRVDGDTFLTSIEPIIESIEDNFNNSVDIINRNIFPILQSESQDEFFELLISFFNTGAYESFRDSLKQCLNLITQDVEQAGIELQDYIDILIENCGEFGQHWVAIQNGTADFRFSFTILGTEYEDTVFVFSRSFFDMLEIIGDIVADIEGAFSDGISWLDSVMSIYGGDVMPGVNFIRDGLGYSEALIDTLKFLLSNQPFSPLEIDVSRLDLFKDVIAEIDTLLGGKEYPIGPEEEGKTIKPLAILQNMPGNGLWVVYEDFYREGEPEEYTFGDIFPNGMLDVMLSMIHSDAIINANDNQQQFEDRLDTLLASWLEEPIDPDDHIGIALVLLYNLLTDEQIHSDLERVFHYLDEGRIDSLTYHYDWGSFDYSDRIREIRHHIDQYIGGEPSNFVILIKEQEDEHGRYVIGEGSEFSIIHLTVMDVALVTGMVSLACDGVSMIADELISIYEELPRIFLLDLDPNVLDFSEAESDTDIILILEASNPEFLTITPYGVEKFREAGKWLKNSFFKLNKFFSQMFELAVAVYPYQDDFGIDGNEFIYNMARAKEITHWIWRDFAYPDSTVIIDGERVNLSAWFDNPPQSLLSVWENYVFGIDSTLGGIFPDRYVGINPDEFPTIPKELCLYPVYPNPFNPTAHIEFDLPKPSDVKLSIINLRGETVEIIVNERLKAGRKSVIWNPKNIPSGVYLCALEIDGNVVTKKITLLK